MPTASTMDVPRRHGGRRSKRRSSSSLGADYYSPTWAVLSRGGARQDGFHGDRTTSAAALTSDGEQVSVSLHLVEPPLASVLTLDWLQGPIFSKDNSFASTPDVLAAHRDLVLFGMPTCRAAIDYFVYGASSDPSRRPSSLSLLPLHSEEEEEEGSPRRHTPPTAPEKKQHRLCWKATDILSCGTNKQDDYSSSSFIVAQLEVETLGGAEVTVHLFQSDSGEWEVKKNLHVHGVTNHDDLFWWKTDAVVPYRHKFLIWVDYFRGMIMADMSKTSPELRYVPLPVFSIPTSPEEPFGDGRECPEASRSVCATRYGIKFVSVDTQQISSFGLGCMRKWKSTFRITTWSFREDDNTWRRDATVYEELWVTLDPENRLPHVSPEFPVVDMEDPDAVCVYLNKRRYNSKEPTWMIKVQMRKMVLLSATAYSSKDARLSGDDHTIDSARMRYHDLTFITSEVPRYLQYGRQDCKKRRK